MLYISNSVGAAEFESAAVLAKETLESTRQYKPLNLDNGADVITELKNVITWQLNIKDYDRSLLESQLKLKLKNDPEAQESIISIIQTDKADEKSIFKKLSGLKNTCTILLR